MKYIFVILLAISPLTDLDKIAKVNEIKKDAKEAYNKGNYKKAIKQYTYLLDSMKVEDDNITLNLANAYYQLKDSASMVKATNNYEALTSSSDVVVKSVAHQQLGIMADRSKKFEEALDHFKNAIRANPKNDEARYNYEMLKKMLDEQKKKNDQNKDKDQQNKDQKKQDQQNQQNKDKNQQNKDQQKQDQKNKDGKDKDNKDQQKQDQQNKEDEKKDDQKKQDQQKQKDGKKGDEKKDQQPKPQDGKETDKKKGDDEQMKNLSDKLKEMKISEEKAKMILEALKNNEIQYIQQNKKKATKRKDPNKPDW